MPCLYIIIYYDMLHLIMTYIYVRYALIVYIIGQTIRMNININKCNIYTI